MAAEQTDTKRVHGFVNGRVQGVGFRYFVMRQAEKAKVTGWVRNRRDGRVEFVAEGSARAVDQLIAGVRSGPPSSFVSSVDLTWEPPQEDASGFTIRWTV